MKSRKQAKATQAFVNLMRLSPYFTHKKLRARDSRRGLYWARILQQNGLPDLSGSSC